MKNWILAAAAALFVSTSSAEAPQQPVAAVPAAAVEVAAPVPPLEDWVAPPKLARLTGYLESLMRAWPHAAPSVPVVDFHEFAQDVASVALREPAAWDGTRLADPDRSKTAVLLLTLAYWEGSRFAAYVDRDLCSDPEWRKSGEGRRLMHLGGDCDGERTKHGVVARAHSSFQLHEFRFPHGDECVAATVRDRQWAIHCALRVARSSLKRHGKDAGTLEERIGNLSDYSGEWSGSHPAANLRLNWARRAWNKYPFDRF